MEGSMGMTLEIPEGVPLNYGEEDLKKDIETIKALSV
jgi:predicted HTH domain antitoxin